LQATIPHHRLKQIDEKKDTKITTLRCAITYINSLSDLLHDINDGKSVSPEYYFTDAQLGLEAAGQAGSPQHNGVNSSGNSASSKKDRGKKAVGGNKKTKKAAAISKKIKAMLAALFLDFDPV
jgi:hypothetical protein